MLTRSKQSGTQYFEDARLPVVFISYSWDSEVHKTWVRTLAERLVQSGVQVILDQWHIGPGESLTHFMETSINRAEFVLVICTPNYARRSNGRRGGVGYEQQIISGRMAMGLKDKRFVPILRRETLSPGRSCAMPTHLGGIFALDMRRSDCGDQDFDELVRAIFAKPRFRPPPLGRAPMFETKRDKQEIRRASSLRLPNTELDGYELWSGVVQTEKYPDTFYIPSETARRKLKKGHLVKLIFYLCEEGLSDGELSGERMWVKIVGTRGVYLVGKLMNQPLASDDQGWPLKYGDKVMFLPEHVIDIERPGN